MGLCLSSLQSSTKPKKRAGPEKSQVAFSAGLENLLRDADLHKSSTGQSTHIELPADHLETLRGDGNLHLLKSSNAKTRFRRNVNGEGKPSMTSTRKSVERKPSTTATRKSFDRKPSTGPIRNPVDGRPMATSGQKSVHRSPSTPSTRKTLVGNTPEGPSKAEAFNGLHHKSKDSDVDSNESAERFQGTWQSLEHLLKKSADGRKSMSRDSRTRRPVVASPIEVYGDSHGTRMSPAPRPVGRKSVDRKPAAERKPVERTSVARKPAQRNLADSSNSMERNLADSSNSMERNSVARRLAEGNLTDTSNSMERRAMDRKPVPERKPVEIKLVERKSVDRKSVDRPFVDKKFVPQRKSVDRKSVDRKSVDRKLVSERIKGVEHSDVGATNVSGRRSMDRVGDSSPDHHSEKGLKKMRARNGYFTPERGTDKSVPDSRKHHSVDRRFRNSFADLDFLTQKFLIDNSEQTIQARIDGVLSGHAAAGQHDPADSSSSRDVRSAEQINEFTKSCRESAAKAKARDLDAFKSLTSLDTSTDSSR